MGDMLNRMAESRKEILQRNKHWMIILIKVKMVHYFVDLTLSPFPAR